MFVISGMFSLIRRSFEISTAIYLSEIQILKKIRVTGNVLITGMESEVT